MTCIAGIIDPITGEVYMAGDSFTGSNGLYCIRKNSKVFVREFPCGTPLIAGTCGPSKLGDIVRHLVELPKMDFPPDGEELRGQLIRHLIPQVKKLVIEAGLVEKRDGADRFSGGVLIGLQGHLYSFGGNMGLIEDSTPFDAIGRGAEVTIGHLMATEKLRLSPEKRLYDAMEACSRVIDCVKAPFHVLKIPGPAKV